MELIFGSVAFRSLYEGSCKQILELDQYFLATDLPVFHIPLQKKSIICVAGEIFNLNELKQHFALPADSDEATVIYLLLRKFPIIEVAGLLAGSFHILYYNAEQRAAHFWVDPLGDHYSYIMKKEDRLLISSGLHLMPSGETSLNAEWISSYFDGTDSIVKKTALTEVEKVGGGQLLKIESNKAVTTNYFDFPKEVEKAVEAAKHSKRSEHQAVLEHQTILTQTLAHLEKKYKKLSLLFSQGIDSVCLAGLASSMGLELHTLTKLYSQDLTTAEVLHDKILNSYAIKNNIKIWVDDDQINQYFDSKNILQPISNFWSTIVIDYPCMIEPLIEENAGCILTGHGGDETYLHRHYYYIFYALLQPENKVLLAELKEIYRTSSDEENRSMKKILLTIEHHFSEYYSAKPYSFYPQDLMVHKLRLFFYHCDQGFADYFAHEYRIFRGLSCDRDFRMLAGLPVVSPLKDHRLLLSMLSLPPSLVLKGGKTPWIQAQILMNTCGQAIYAPKAANYSPSKRRFPLTDELRSLTLEALEFIEDFGLRKADYYRERCECFLRDNFSELELYRLVGFYCWYKTWKNSIP